MNMRTLSSCRIIFPAIRVSTNYISDVIDVSKWFACCLIIYLQLLFTICSAQAYGGSQNGTNQNSSQTQSSQQGNSSQGSQSGQSGQQSSPASLGGTVLAYDFSKKAGDYIADQVISYCGKEGITTNGPVKKLLITITPPNSMGNLVIYDYFRQFYSLLIKDYESSKAFPPIQFENTPFIPTETAGDLAGAASTILSLFATTTTTTGSSATTDPLSVVPSICNHLLTVGYSINQPAIIQPVYVDLSLDGSFIGNSNSFAGLLLTASRYYAAANNYISLNTPTTNSQIGLIITNLLAYNALYTSFATNINGGALGPLLNIDYIDSELKDPNNYLLYVTNSYLIAEMRVKSNPILNIFTDGPRLSFIGGGGVAYFLYHGTNMQIVLSGRVDGYEGYRKFKYRKLPWLRHIKNKVEDSN